jgi:3-hydroxy acid dehydrogenase/malonic semialdehyde reductase
MRDAAVRGSGSTTQENQIKLKDQRVILTGAAGGMGSILANLIADAGAEVALIDANAEALQELAASIDGSHAVPADLSTEEG